MNRRIRFHQRPQFPRIDRRHPLARGLVFAGLGGGASTLKYVDSSPYGNHGTLTNMDPATDWVWDSTLNRFVTYHAAGGSPQYVLLPAQVTFGVGYTFSCFIRPTALASYNMCVGLSGVTTDALALRSTQLWLRCTGNTKGDATWAYTFAANNTYHVTLSRTTSALYSAWVNGVSIGTDDCDGGFLLQHIGAAYASATYYHEGFIADPMIHNRLLSTAELQQLADPSNVMLSGLVLPPRRRLWAVTGGAVTPSWIWARQQQAQVIGGGAL